MQITTTITLQNMMKTTCGLFQGVAIQFILSIKN